MAYHLNKPFPPPPTLLLVVVFITETERQNHLNLIVILQQDAMVMGSHWLQWEQPLSGYLLKLHCD